ncbi:MAG TPA: hypothetical protein VN420_01815 [Candidatus Fimivivens sp.]|nr:hypothetical protein [Candidatus Fimivivens sp.]
MPLSEKVYELDVDPLNQKQVTVQPRSLAEWRNDEPETVVGKRHMRRIHQQDKFILSFLQFRELRQKHPATYRDHFRHGFPIDIHPNDMGHDRLQGILLSIDLDLPPEEDPEHFSETEFFYRSHDW